jgi:hypothetical protein
MKREQRKARFEEWALSRSIWHGVMKEGKEFHSAQLKAKTRNEMVAGGPSMWHGDVGLRKSVSQISLAQRYLAARLGADQQRIVGVLKALVEVGGLHDSLQQREGAVLELHRHALWVGVRVREIEETFETTKT